MSKTFASAFLAIVTIGALGGSVSAQPAMNDGHVFALFDEANTADIWTARLAMSRSQNAAVKDLAGMVIADHEAVQQMSRDLARKLKITATPPANDDSAGALAASIKALQGKSGAEFDRAYLTHELAFHRAAIDTVRGTLLPSAKNDELRALLTKVLAGFEHHLAETRGVAGTLGVR